MTRLADGEIENARRGHHISVEQPRTLAPNIMKAKKKPIARDEADYGGDTAPRRRVEDNEPAGRKDGVKVGSGRLDRRQAEYDGVL